MTLNRTLLLIPLAVLLAAGGYWLAAHWQAADDSGPHADHADHAIEARSDTDGTVYYTCSMHPQVRLDAPGSCPICNMRLSRRVDPAASDPAREDAGREVLYWYDPMRPDQHFDAPGRSPFMDMDLVPKYADAQGDGESAMTVRIDPRMVQNLGMRTAEVARGRFWQRVDTVGRVDVDERSVVTVESRTAGWIETLDVRAVGDRVRKGQRLAALYSPDLQTARQELQLAERAGDPGLIDASRQRLQRLGGARGAALHAPVDGYVRELMVREGAQLSPGMALLRLADLSRVWVQVEVPEAQANQIDAGRPAELRLPALPGQTFEARVDYRYPELDPVTRTQRLRLVVDNPDGQLRPGMFAEVTLFGGALSDQLLIPSEALIRTGRRNTVIVAEGEGRFRPTAVVVGAERNDQTVVLSGLEAGQRIVVSGQFLIDSEASLQGAYRRMGTAAEGDRP